MANIIFASYTGATAEMLFRWKMAMRAMKNVRVVLENYSFDRLGQGNWM